MSKRFFSAILCAALILALAPAAFVPAALAAEELLYRFTFDNEAEHGEYFTAVGEPPSADYEWVSGFGRTDDTALKAVHKDGAPYISNLNAVRLTFPEPLPAGGVYRVVAWVYAASADNPGKGTLTGPGFVLNDDYPGNQGEVKFPPDFGTLPMDEWKQIDVTMPLQEAPITTLDFRLVINDADKHPDVWYWDDIEIYQVGGLEDVDPVVEFNPATDVIVSNRQGTYEGFFYERWSEKPELANMKLTGGGIFTCEWDAFNVLFRTGRRLERTKTYKEYGEITMEYDASVSVTKGSVNYLTVYGWLEQQDPLVEYYILEDRGSYKPGGEDLRGTYDMDGGTYELYVDIREEQPSIDGIKTFDQYFAIRTENRTSGTISVSEHFKKWEELGLDMSGILYEVTLCVEGFGGAGSAEVYKHVLTIGGEVYGTDNAGTAPEGTEGPAEAPEATEGSVPAESAAPSGAPAEDDSGLPVWLIAVLIAVGIVIAGAVLAVVMRKKKA